MALGEKPQPQILRHVGVLVLVHQHVFEPALILLQHVRMVLEDAQGFKQQVAEIAGVHHFQALLVFGVKLATQAIGESIGLTLGQFVRGQAAVLPAVDRIRQLPGGPALLVDVMGIEQLLHQANLVVGIEDGEARFEARQFGMVAQDFDADGMEGAEPGHALDHAADQRADPVLHLARRLVGEGDGEYLARPGFAGGEDVGKPGGQHPGLAGAGAGQHEQGAVGGFHRRALFRVQALQIGRLSACQRPLRRGFPALRRRRALVAEVADFDGPDGHGAPIPWSLYSNGRTKCENQAAFFTSLTRLRTARWTLRQVSGSLGVARALAQLGMPGGLCFGAGSMNERQCFREMA